MPIAMLSTSLLTNPQRYGRFNALDTPQPTKPGMVLMKPTSITHSGTSATLGANGQVTFTAVTSLSLNGVFTADFDNYVIYWKATASAAHNLYCRLRASGSDATGTDYTVQYLESQGSSVNGYRETVAQATIMNVGSSNNNGTTFTVYGPFAAAPTASRSVTVGGDSGGYIYDQAWTHSLSTSYDGFTLYRSGSTANVTGVVAVYGVRS